MPLQTRRGGTSSLWRDERLDLDQQRPRALHRREDDRARRLRGLADEARAGVEDLDEAALAHLEDADLVRRAEAVLQRAQRAVGALALALELQHAVDEVLEHARAGQRALLGDVADEQDGGALALGHLADPRRHLAHLADRARRGLERARECSVWTESMTQASGRSASSAAEHGVEVGLGQHGDLERVGRPGARRAGGSAPPTPRRRRRAWRARPRRGGRGPCSSASTCRCPASRRAGRASPGTRPPPRTRSSSPMRGAQPRRALGADLAQRHRPRAPGPRRAPRGRARAAWARAPRPACSTRRTPGTARATWASARRRRSRRTRRSAWAPAEPRARAGRIRPGVWPRPPALAALRRA